VYALQFSESGSGFTVVESWVNRDKKQYSGEDLEFDRRLVRDLIDALLLHDIKGV
jgi:hypothetical protein